MAPILGQLFGLGVGPGDPELLTLKAMRLLRAAPCRGDRLFYGSFPISLLGSPADTGSKSFQACLRSRLSLLPRQPRW
jgi:hypothetical protein